PAEVRRSRRAEAHRAAGRHRSPGGRHAGRHQGPRVHRERSAEDQRGPGSGPALRGRHAGRLDEHGQRRRGPSRRASRRHHAGRPLRHEAVPRVSLRWRQRRRLQRRAAARARPPPGRCPATLHVLARVVVAGEEARGAGPPTASLYGSRQLAGELAKSGRLPGAMILVDMIGDRDLTINREAHSAPWLTDIIWESAAALGCGRHFRRELMPVEDDHVPFLRLGVPAALLIDFNYPPWHTAEDTVDKVSAQSLAVVGEVLLEALPSVELQLSKGGGP